ncbi:histidine phosphatase family protein [Gordonia tangerina]|uniref:Histidine phosphatase family protein n=1 Tax=Gordonia tangerina TaxID=2911060 RepID=A0ABS9DJ45_9ACTN|nr:histidine phosphatase family protein [Gordonia tangerina]MCF3939152.1 histidine phosphatase family protein [Gordonia tangerina]
MLIVTAGRTGPNRSVRFGGDASLDDRGRRDVAGLRAEVTATIGAGRVAGGPERAVVESSDVLQIQPVTTPALRSLDVGRWTGRMPTEITPDDLAAWFTDPVARPHGGESVARFVERIHRWYVTDGADTDLCVVSMPVAQALLCTDPEEFFGVEIRPATIYHR